MKGETKKSYIVVILIQCIYTGMFLLSKAAFNEGMNTFIFVFYRQALATIFLTPLALFFEWNKAPPMSLAILCKIFLLSLVGITLSLNIYGVALVYTSASLAAASTNSLPVITFFVAVLLRLEMVNVRTRAGVAKLGGIILCVCGVIVIAFYKGPSLILSHIHIFGNNLSNQNHVDHAGDSNSNTTWIKGCFLMLLSNTCFCLWMVFQTPVLKSYPSKLLLTTLQCLFSTIQSFVIAIAFERDPNQWKLQWNVELLAVTYCDLSSGKTIGSAKECEGLYYFEETDGIMVTGVTFYLQTWVIEKKGAVFVAMSTPLSLIFTLFSSALFLGEIISLGSVLGGICLVGGLYSVLWGKSKEHKMVGEICSKSNIVEIDFNEDVGAKDLPIV